MNTNTQTFRFRQLVVLLLITAMAGVGFTSEERSQQRSQGRQRSEAGKANASRQSDSSAGTQAHASTANTASRSQAQQPASRPQPQPAAPRQQAAPQRSVSRPAAQAAQPTRQMPSTRSAPSTRQAQSTRSVNAPSTPQTAAQPIRQRTVTVPSRPVNRTVEVVTRAGRSANANTSRTSSRVSVVTRGSSNVSTATPKTVTSALSRTVTPSVTITPQASAATTTTRQRVTEKVTPSRTITTRQRVAENASAVPSQPAASRQRAAEKITPAKSTAERTQTASRMRTESDTTHKISAGTTTPTLSRKVQTTPDRTSAEKSSGALSYYGAASRSKTRQAASVKIEADTARTSTRQSTITPQRVTVDDIKTQPQRVVAGETRSRPSSRDVQQKQSVRIQSESRPSRSGSRTAGAATTVAVQNDLSRSTAGRHHEPRRSEPATKIVINNDNRVIVQGSPTMHRPRPYISRHLFHDVSYIRTDPHWRHYGSGFYFSWSSSSCGVVVSLPYYHTTVHYGTPYYGLSYCYPRYHRKYVFVSLGGYWPYDYRYRRYYWYGCHPYYWYGSHVIYEPTPSVTYNTYNYYNTNTTADTTGYGFSSSAQPYYTLGNPKEEPVDEPQFQTAADLCFDHAVTLFAAGSYDDAVEQFREAVKLSPDDVILPFTYSQALFAQGDYAHAATVLRTAMLNIPEDELTIYYPRGLYEDEKVLNGQIDQLRIAAEKEPFASDYQLLLGYQYLGLGDLQKARVPLTTAASDPANQIAAGKLLELAAQLEKEAQEQSQSGS